MRHDEDYKSFTVAAVASRGARIRRRTRAGAERGSARGADPARRGGRAGAGLGLHRPPGSARRAQPSSEASGKKTAARPDSRRATGTRKGEQET